MTARTRVAKPRRTANVVQLLKPSTALKRAKRDIAAARRFLERAINLHDVLKKITTDKSGANRAESPRL